MDVTHRGEKNIAHALHVNFKIIKNASVHFTKISYDKIVDSLSTQSYLEHSSIIAYKGKL